MPSEMDGNIDAIWIDFPSSLGELILPPHFGYML